MGNKMVAGCSKPKKIDIKKNVDSFLKNTQSILVHSILETQQGIPEEAAEVTMADFKILK